MPVDWKKYAADWKDIAKAKKAAVGWKCEECGRQCRKPEEKFDTHRRTLTVHHIDGDPGNNAPENLIALCPRCHLMRHRGSVVRERRGRNTECSSLVPASRQQES